MIHLIERRPCRPPYGSFLFRCRNNGVSHCAAMHFSHSLDEYRGHYCHFAFWAEQGVKSAEFGVNGVGESAGVLGADSSGAGVCRIEVFRDECGVGYRFGGGRVCEEWDGVLWCDTV
ncbi:hypothetical protein WG66_009202 [Moniliophthora roreri]|nr:hypothetical protein WG66_002563 [Moniliophthora roreri]KAI3621610.1 hypothetical protein WG66_009202 [Moniliophthora roreri]